MVSLEDMVKTKKPEKNLVISDIHFPYQDDDSLDIMFRYAQDYKPHNIYVNGDLVDFYTLSKFSQNPVRKASIPEEVRMAQDFMKRLRENFKKSDIYFLHGNHENRLQRYLWENPQLAELECLEIGNLFDLKSQDIKEIKANRDYWGKEDGAVTQGDAIIFHGDARLNGASTSKYSGYSAKNTMLGGLQHSIVMGHIHRLAVVHHSTPDGTLVGVEGGCLCQIPKHANWQNGFVTFETSKGKNHNYKVHLIEDGKLYEEDKVYGK